MVYTCIAWGQSDGLMVVCQKIVHTAEGNVGITLSLSLPLSLSLSLSLSPSLSLSLSLSPSLSLILKHTSKLKKSSNKQKMDTCVQEN